MTASLVRVRRNTTRLVVVLVLLCFATYRGMGVAHAE